MKTQPARWQYLASLEQHSQKDVYALSQHPIYGVVSPIARIYGSRNKGVEMRVAPLVNIPSDPLEKNLLPIPTNYALLP